MRSRRDSKKIKKADVVLKKIAKGEDSEGELIELISPKLAPPAQKQGAGSYSLQFLPNTLEFSENQITMNFPVLIRDRDTNKKKHVNLNLFAEPNQFSEYRAFLQLSFKRIEDKSYLFLKCQSVTNVLEYNLNPILRILTESITSAQGGVFDRTEVIGDAKRITVNTTIVHGASDLDKLLKDVFNFKINCLKRFEELVKIQDVEAYENASALDIILDKIISDYTHIEKEKYEYAFARLVKVLEHDDFRYDPQIMMSLPPIRQALGILSENKTCRNQGVPVNEIQMQQLFQELKKLEGDSPGTKSCLALGSVDNFFQSIDDFSLPNLGTTSAKI